MIYVFGAIELIGVITILSKTAMTLGYWLLLGFLALDTAMFHLPGANASTMLWLELFQMCAMMGVVMMMCSGFDIEEAKEVVTTEAER